MMAHFDVVPVDPTTVSQWTHPPFSGHYDGTNIWGRGSSDDKAGLIGTIGAVEILLELKAYKPKRTVILAFGFDEECGGTRGAGELSKVVKERYGNDGVALIIDEGGGFVERDGAVFASPGIAEKGNTNTRVEVNTAGGHSSVPPVHTVRLAYFGVGDMYLTVLQSIGILSALLVHIESNPPPVHIVSYQGIKVVV
jgi:Gly-Xaa carboxypeptidase